MNCLLCQASDAAPFKVEKKPERAYFYCAGCDAIFMEPTQRLGPKEEKERYDQHQNEASSGYVAFFDPLIKFLENHYRGQNSRPEDVTLLDYGSGPTQLLSNLLGIKGFKTFNYDLYYNPNPEQLRRNYDVITCTEVWEHLYEPRKDIERVLRLLKPGGILAVMTSAHKGEAAFHDWHYRRDPTHVIFYSDKTMAWLAQRYGLKLLKSQSPYFYFQKN